MHVSAGKNKLLVRCLYYLYYNRKTNFVQSVCIELVIRVVLSIKIYCKILRNCQVMLCI